jgi:glycosyltransferase involved in cell wall biosynthesis
VVTSVFYTFRDSPQRRAALASRPGAPERYALYGLDELRAQGLTVRHNLEQPDAPPAWARSGGRLLKAGLERAGGHGGDFPSVLASLREANRADVVLSTVDTVGIPLMLLGRAGRLRPPLVYVAIGLPERLARLRGPRMRRLYAESLARCASVVAYSEREAAELERFLGSHRLDTRVEFAPFGVDTRVLVPSPVPTAVDVASVGADPHRDYDLLLRVAEQLPDASFLVVTTADVERGLAPLPPNVTVETDLPFDTMRRRLEGARVVALPVRDNSYSGATTVLLQAMALGKAIVVSRTAAIATGYGLEDGDNVRLVPPGDEASFARALGDVLRDDLHARALGSRARSTVEASLTWDRYVERLRGHLDDAAAVPARPGSAGG